MRIFFIPIFEISVIHINFQTGGTPPYRWTITAVAFSLFLSLASTVFGHSSNTLSISETMEEIEKKLETLETKTLESLNTETILHLLSDQQKESLAKNYLTFTVNQPVTLHIIKAEVLKHEPFWLYDSAFKKQPITIDESNLTFEIWSKEYPKGDIRLGMHAFRSDLPHYAVVLTPKSEKVDGITGDNNDELELSHPYPKSIRLTPWTKGAKPFLDENYQLRSEPALFANSYIVQLKQRRRKLTKLIGLYRSTDYPATLKPDQIKLTYCGKPTDTICIQWRTAPNPMSPLSLIPERMPQIRYRSTEDIEWTIQLAKPQALSDPKLINNPSVILHTVKLTELKPKTVYEYQVSMTNPHIETAFDEKLIWSRTYTYQTPAIEPEPFSFIYMGDAQNGLDVWGTLIHKSVKRHPEGRFIIMAGDLVDRGGDRDDWDHFFQHASPIFAQRPIVPALGNHEYPNGEPELYLSYFTLRNNGPRSLPRGKAYYFNYSNALFIILDSNLPPSTQSEWLESVLRSHRVRPPSERPKWTFVIFHHPAYSAYSTRDNMDIREEWVPIFDEYQVDFILQGHDHSYLRTYPLRNGEPAEKGSIYVVSVSGTKLYAQDQRKFGETAFVKIPTYQLIDISLDQDRLHYRAFSAEGKTLDEVEITKGYSFH